MGQKANPKSLRLGISDTWDSVWFDTKKYSDKVLIDQTIRNFINKELFKAGITKIVISRKSDYIDVAVSVARPGIVFSKSGLDLDFINVALRKLINSNVNIRVLEHLNPDSSAPIICAWVCSQIEKRVPFRRAMKMAIQKCLKSGAYGVKISASGRLGGVEIARCEWYKEGTIQLSTFKNLIDYSSKQAKTTYGIIGVKVWISKGIVEQPEVQKEIKKSVKSKKD